LVSVDASLWFLCYGGSADTDPVAIDGWITSPEAAIRIEAPEATLLRGPGQRHLGRWTPEAYRLEVEGNDCIRSTVGNLTIDGLQLFCSGDHSANVAGIRLENIDGDVEIVETLIRLDDANGDGERAGLAITAATQSSVVVRNTVMWDLGSGQGDPQTGILVESSNVTMLAANNTIAGGRTSIVNNGGTVTAINNLLLEPSVAGVDGDLEPESRLNLGAGSSSPNPPANTVGPIVMTNPVRGPFADFHLACSVLDLAVGEDVVLTENLYPDNWPALFDGRSETLAVTPPATEATVQLEFSEPRAIVGTGIAFSNANAHAWRVETAMSVEELEPGSPSYLELVERTDVNHRERGREFVRFASPQEFRVIRLTAWRTDGDPNVPKNIHIGEWWLEGLNPACGQGADHSNLASDSFAGDVDGNARVGAWDIGADQSNELMVGFVNGPVEWWEKEGAARAQVMLSEPAPVPVSVRYSTLDGSARADGDYEATKGTLVFEPGEVSKIISVPIKDEGAWESVEDFWVELFDAVGARLDFEWRRFEVRDGTGPVRVRLKDPLMVVSEADRVVNVEFELSKSNSGVTVGSWDVTDHTAFFSTDYRGPGDGAPWQNYTVPAGGLGGSVQYEIIHDEELEPDEGFVVWAGDVFEAERGVPSRGYVRIHDSGLPPPSVFFEAEELVVEEGSGTVQLRVLLSKAPEGDVSVRYRLLEQDQAWPEAATAGLDYVDTPGELVFNAGELEQTINIGILEDDLVEEIGELFVVELFEPTGLVMTSPSMVTVWIEDNEPRPIIAYLEPGFIEVNEGDGSIEFLVLLTEEPMVPVSVRYQTISGSAKPGFDYEVADDVLEFTAGQWEQSFQIQLVNDLLYEGIEAFGVRLYDPAGLILEFQHTSDVVVYDDDELPVLVTFENEAVEFSEDADTVQLGVRLEMPMTTDATVRYRTVAGSAVPELDFEAVDDELTFLAGQVEQTIEISLVNDGTPEDREDFRVELYDPHELGLGYPPFTQVGIVDDEPRPTTIAFSVGVDSENRLSGPIGIDITDGLATFAEPTWHFGLARGDRLEIEDGGAVFLGACSSDTECPVFTGQGGVPSDIEGGMLTSASRAFPSLHSAVAGAADAEHLGTWDLSAANTALEILCYSGWGEPDTTPVSIDGWITSPENPIRVIVPALPPRNQPFQRHSGRWDDIAYHLDVPDATCITSSVGNLVIEGLQLHCSGDPGSDVYGVLLDGIDGDVRISETIVRLDGVAAAADRVGVSLESAASGELVVRNSILYDLGDGSSEHHAGIVNSSPNATLFAANNTILGSAYGIRSLGGGATAVNNLVLDTTVTCYDGQFATGSMANLASDESAPNPPEMSNGAVTLTDPTTGGQADLHLECGIGRKVDEIFNDFGGSYPESIEPAFDGDLETYISSQNINPARIVLGFDEAQIFTGMTVEVSGCDNHQWMVEAADTIDDLLYDGSSRTIVGQRSFGTYDSESFAAPETAGAIALTVWGNCGGNDLRLNEWNLFGQNPACGQGRDLSDASHAFGLDVDSAARHGDWDIGADQDGGATVAFADGPTMWFEDELEARIQVVLSEPVAAEVRVRWEAFDGTALAGEDYLQSIGVLTFPPGVASQIISIPLVTDGSAEDEEEFFIALTAVTGAGFQWNEIPGRVVQIIDGDVGFRIGLASDHFEASEEDGKAIVWVEISQALEEDIATGFDVVGRSAKPGRDFVQTVVSARIPAGRTQVPMTIDLVDDDSAEPIETFVVKSIFEEEGPPSIALVRVEDDDSEKLQTERSENPVAGTTRFNGSDSGKGVTLRSSRSGASSSIHWDAVKLQRAGQDFYVTVPARILQSPVDISSSSFVNLSTGETVRLTSPADDLFLIGEVTGAPGDEFELRLCSEDRTQECEMIVLSEEKP